MSRNLDETNVKDQVIEKYGKEAGEKIYQVLKELDENVRMSFEKAIKEQLGEDAAAEIDYGLLRQWISLGG
jgi:chaperonin GroEL (HSP60 family)